MPTLRVLAERPDVEHIRVFSFERQATEPYTFDLDKVEHCPIYSGVSSSVFGHQLRFIQAFSRLRKSVYRTDADLIICRGVMAGAYGFFLHKWKRIPFIVESFEPHADYMADSNTWSKSGLKYRFQKFIEFQEREAALALISVSENYAQFLQKHHRTKHVYCAPCPVDMQRFHYSEEDRNRIRQHLQFSDGDVVGIYIGKFGDIYYTPTEAFELLSRVKKLQPNFKMLFLTDLDEGVLLKVASKQGFDAADVRVAFVDHSEVSAYLSAADLGFCLVRPSEHRPYCCPIKDGEYWAAGLPVIIPEGVGDDSAIIAATGHGVVLKEMNGASLSAADLEGLQTQRETGVVQALAREYRSVDRTREAYDRLLSV